MTALKRNTKSIIHILFFMSLCIILVLYSVFDRNWWLASGPAVFIITYLFDLNNLLKIRKGLKITNEY